MTAYLAYSYSACLTKEERDKIDIKTKKNRTEFSKGFRTGAKISLFTYGIYLLLRADIAHASDSCPDPGQIAPPANQGVAQPAPVQNLKPGFKPLNEGIRGTLVGGVGSIALQSGDFLLGLSCAFLLVIGGIVVNRPHPHVPPH